MALHAYAQLSANGTALTGDTMLVEIGGVDVSSDHIEIYELIFGSSRGISGKTGRARGHRQLSPIEMVKRTDQTTPLLYQALSENQRIDGDIKLFDADPETGEIRHRFTVSVTKARVSSLTTVSPDVYDAEASNRPIYDLLEIVAGTITYTDLVNSVEYSDSEMSASSRSSSKRSSKASSSKGKKKKK
jgi:type VI secretion system secreted protein Hcp